MPAKSYTGFILWLIAFVAVLMLLCFLPVQDGQVLIRLIVLLTAWGIAGLAFLIWRTERIYWYNGTSYEEAADAGRERRKAFAWKHLRIFGLYAMGLTVLCSVLQLLGISAWVDFVVGSVGLIAAAFATMPIRL